MTVDALAELRVVDLSRGVGGAYASKLFADAGADVVIVEPPAGSPLRWVSDHGTLPADGPDGALFRFLAAGKRSLVGELGDPTVDELIAGADVVIEDFPAGVAEAAGLLDRPGLVVVSLTAFGRGPYQDRPANDFIAQAVAGSIAARGLPEREPIYASGRLSDLAAGIFAAPAALAAVRAARSTGAATHIDVSAAEAIYICTNLYSDLMFRLLGFVPPTPSRNLPFPGIERTLDGWVGLNTNSRQKLDDLLVMIDRADLVEHADVRTDPVRKADFESSARAWLAARPTEEIIELATAFRIPVAPVGSGETITSIDHFVERGVFVDEHYGNLAPRSYYRIGDDRPGPTRPAPTLGDRLESIDQHTPVAAPSAAAAATDGSADAGATPPTLPLAGMKVLDLTAWWAGPSCTQLLAALGADVIHVESIQVIDAMRPAAALFFVDRDQWWEYSAFFLSINPNKRGITLDMNSEEGRRLLRGLIEWADVLVENYTPRVAEGWGVTWDEVRAINPSIVMARMPAFGLDGPWRDRVGFAQTMEQVSGLSWCTGYADGPPVMPQGPCDPLGGMHAAFAVLSALERRDRTGEGAFIECPLVESALNLAAERVIEFSAYGDPGQRLGNRSRERAPQGVYRCAGNEQWLALSVDDDARWTGLVDALGSPAWAKDPALSTVTGRIDAHDQIDEHLAAWATERELADAVDTLLAHGVPAAPVTDARKVLDQQIFVERGFSEWIEHPVVGRQLISSIPYRWSGISRWLRTPAPTLGQHNAEVLTDILGLSADEIDALAAAGVIGTRPVGV